MKSPTPPRLSDNQSPIGSLGPCNGCADLGLVPIPGRSFPDLLPRNAKSVSSDELKNLAKEAIQKKSKNS